MYALRKTQIAPENGWLEDYVPFGKAYFLGLYSIVLERVGWSWSYNIATSAYAGDELKLLAIKSSSMQRPTHLCD